MKIPKKINILGIEYSVVLFENDYKVAQFPEKSFLRGQILYNNKKIRLWKNQTDYSLRETLIHEIIHGCLRESILEDFIKEEMVESFTEMFSKIINDTLSRNHFLK
jgi:hypothetical protein